MKILPVGDRRGPHGAESSPLETFRKRPERSARPNSGLRQTKPALQAARLVLLRAPRLVLRPAPSAHRLGLGSRRPPRRTLFPQPAMPENLLKHQKGLHMLSAIHPSEHGVTRVSGSGQSGGRKRFGPLPPMNPSVGESAVQFAPSVPGNPTSRVVFRPSSLPQSVL